MKPFTLALLGSVALAATFPGIAAAQTAPAPAAPAPSLNDMLGCEDDEGSAVSEPGAPGAPTTGTGTGTGTTPAPGGTATPGATPTATPTPAPTPTSPGTVFGPSEPVVQPVPTATPTPTPSPTATPGGGTGTAPTYYTAAGGLRTSTVTDDLGTRTIFRASSNAGASYRHDLATVYPYSAPTRGISRTIGGQKIGVSSSAVTTAGLKPQIVNIIDEIVLSARAVGLPDPVITAATNGVHTATSLHGQGLALDLRCNDQPAAKCKAWVAALKNAIGPGYDVMFEQWNPNGNSHVHLEYDGKTAMLDPRWALPFTVRQLAG